MEIQRERPADELEPKGVGESQMSNQGAIMMMGSHELDSDRYIPYIEVALSHLRVVMNVPTDSAPTRDPWKPMKVIAHKWEKARRSRGRIPLLTGLHCLTKKAESSASHTVPQP